MNTNKAIRYVAFFEAFKGLVVLIAATGVLSLIHQDIYQIAVRIIAHSHLDPASKYPQIFLDAASKVDDPKLLMLALGAALYSTLRFVEAYGLYYAKAWAEVLAALSGAIYVPFEVAELIHKPHGLGFIFFLVNLGVVALMVMAMLRRRNGSL